MPNLTHLNIGDHIATKAKNNGLSSYRPQITRQLWKVEKKTATQMTCRAFGGREIRVRITDGKIIGQDYSYAEEATPEMIDTYKAQQQEFNRYITAERQLDSLIDKPAHQLKLTTAQIEALAAAWVSIKEMTA